MSHLLSSNHHIGLGPTRQIASSPTRAALEKKVNVKLGMPKYNCRFHGICQMSSFEAANFTEGCQQEDEPILRASLSIQGRYDRGVLRIPRSQMPAAKEHYHFGRERLVVWEPIALKDILPQVAEHYPWILPGAYQLRQEGENYRMVLRFGETNQ